MNGTGRARSGDADPGHYPLGSAIEVLWDPAAAEIVEKPGVAKWALVAGVLGLGIAILALVLLWARERFR